MLHYNDSVEVHDSTSIMTSVEESSDGEVICWFYTITDLDEPDEYGRTGIIHDIMGVVI